MSKRNKKNKKRRKKSSWNNLATFLLLLNAFTIGMLLSFMPENASASQIVEVVTNNYSRKNESPHYIELDSITTNLQSNTSSSKNYILIDLVLSVYGKKNTEEIQADEPLIRDTILGYLNDKTYEFVLTDTENSEGNFKDGIKDELNKLYGDNTDIIHDILITDMVLQ